MTRRRIIAGVILLAAVVVAVPLVPGVWRALVYREAGVHEGPLPDHKTATEAGFVVAGWRDPGFSMRWYAQRGLRMKRFEWLPGPKVIFQKQDCCFCLAGQHWSCLGVIRLRGDGDYPCCCNDSSHKE